jgi:lysozyme family protein
MMENGFDFNRHLHNGDPLAARTVHAPEGHPLEGDPPFTWQESAIDALKLRGLADQSDWSLARTLYRLEAFNGFGYRRRGIPSPYLWACTNHYISGKFTTVGEFDATATSKQCGTAAVLRELVNRGVIILERA